MTAWVRSASWAKTASKIKVYNDHRELLADKKHRGSRDRRAPQPARRR